MSSATTASASGSRRCSAMTTEEMEARPTIAQPRDGSVAEPATGDEQRGRRHEAEHLPADRGPGAEQVDRRDRRGNRAERR